MTEANERPDPAAALETAFRQIHEQQMRDMPMVNPALHVQALGFRRWNEHWLGVLITPWFMNLMLLPRVPAAWRPIGERETRHYVFPAGVFEFIGGRHAALGDYQACSLFSPMFEFTTQTGAHDTAAAAIGALFDPASREMGEVQRRPAEAARAAHATPVPATATTLARPVSKRDFLFGARAPAAASTGIAADDGS